MLDVRTRQDITQRLRRIEGQMRGLQRMVAEPRLCIDILQQLAAVEAAVGRVRVTIFRHHVSRCVPEALKEGGASRNRRLAELVTIVDQFST